MPDPPTVSYKGELFAFVPTPTGKGYWMIGSDGAVFAFGDAVYVGRLLVTK